MSKELLKCKTCNTTFVLISVKKPLKGKTPKDPATGKNGDNKGKKVIPWALTCPSCKGIDLYKTGHKLRVEECH